MREVIGVLLANRSSSSSLSYRAPSFVSRAAPAVTVHGLAENAGTHVILGTARSLRAAWQPSQQLALAPSDLATNAIDCGMSFYPDLMSLAEAKTLFFRRGNLGADGGYSNRWVRVEAKPFPFYFRNSSGRVAAARLHDLHHIVAEYDSDWPGEVEISGWEIGSGCERFHAAWILDLGAWAVGLVLAPQRLFRAFLRGREATTNLYKTGFPDAQLEHTTVGMLRDRLGLRETSPRPAWSDVTAFAFWSAAAVSLWVGPPMLVAAAGWWFLRT